MIASLTALSLKLFPPVINNKKLDINEEIDQLVDEIIEIEREIK